LEARIPRPGVSMPAILRSDYDWRPKADDLAQLHWQSLVNRYSHGKLTKPEDRLIAFSAIAQRLCERYESKYVAGFPLFTLPLSLLWQRERCDISTAYPQFSSEKCINSYNVPSWSWGSMLTGVFFNTASLSDSASMLDGVNVPLVIATDVQLQDKLNDYGPILSASIILRAPTFVVSFGTANKNGELKNGVLWAEAITQRAKYISISSIMVFPDRTANYSDTTIWNGIVFLVIKADLTPATPLVSGYDYDIRGLVLSPLLSGPHARSYVRLGDFGLVMSIPWPECYDVDLVAEMSIKEVKIV